MATSSRGDINGEKYQIVIENQLTPLG